MLRGCLPRVSVTLAACLLAVLAEACHDEHDQPADGGLVDAAGSQDDASRDAPASESSHGSGGLTCSDTETVSGRTVCVATVGTVELKLVLPADAASNSAPLTLALYLHGDGAGAHNSNSAARVLLPWADAHHAIFVSALAPNACSWWIEPSYTTCMVDDPEQASHQDVDQLNAPALDAALAAIRAAYDIRDAPVFYYGSSGGAIFLTGSFLELYGNQYPGAFALNCGGSDPWGAFAWDVSDATERGPTKLYFSYGAADEAIIPGLAEVPATFIADGFAVVDASYPSQTQHCTFDGVDNHGRAEAVWNDYLAE